MDVRCFRCGSLKENVSGMSFSLMFQVWLIEYFRGCFFFFFFFFFAFQVCVCLFLINISGVFVFLMFQVWFVNSWFNQDQSQTPTTTMMVPTVPTKEPTKKTKGLSTMEKAEMPMMSTAE